MKNTQTVPPTRFPDRLIEKAEARWWIAKTKSRQEKQLAFDLLEREIEYYLPLYKKTYLLPAKPGCKRKKRFYMLPLFTGYIAFAQDSPHDIYKTGRVVQLIEVKNQQRFIKELSVVYWALDKGHLVLPVTHNIEPEMEVEIIKGALKGVRGKVLNIRNSRFLMLSVEGMGKAMVRVSTDSVREI